MDAEPDSPSHHALSVRFIQFSEGALEASLEFVAPLFHPKEVALRQLKYVENYAGQVGCKSFAIEGQYIDRDFMEDYSVFYSKCFRPYGNSCRRVHFFSEDEATVRARISKVMAAARGDEDAYHEACRRASEDVYLGFCVIKPLDGSPVGRTILKCFPPQPDDPARGFVRVFNCARSYIAHFMGVDSPSEGWASSSRTSA